MVSQVSNVLDLWRRLVRILTFVDLRIRGKVTVFTMSTIFWFIVIVGIAIASLLSLREEYRGIIQDTTLRIRIVSDINRDLETIARETRAVLGSGGALEDSAMARDPTRFAALSSHLAALSSVRGITATGTPLDTPEGETSARPRSPEVTLDELSQLLRQRLDKLSRSYSRLLVASRNGAQATQGTATDVETPRAEFEHTLNGALSIAQTLLRDLIAYREQRTADADRSIGSSVVALLLVLSIVIVLLGFFARLFTTAIVVSTQAIRTQIRALAAGEAELTEKVHVSTADEIGKLADEFNELTATVSDMTTFKKVIEDDDTLDDVYMRLGEVFVKKLGIDDFAILEVSEHQKSMRCAYPPHAAERSPYCSEQIYSNCELCRARKTGHRISSLEYPGVCTQFLAAADKDHVCMPTIIGGRTGAVVQLLFDRTTEGSHDVETAIEKVFKAEAYLRQSLSVIEAKRLLNTLREATLRDSLTGLINRRFLQEQVEHLVTGVMRRGKNIGLLMCDIDYFKQVNDQYGHDAGDGVLRETAAVIVDSVRESDIVVRFGGEEFLVLLIDIDEDEALRVAEKIRQNVASHKLMLNGSTISKNISVGISEFPKDTRAFWNAIKFADVALYEGKRTGRNKVVRFEHSMWNEEAF